MTALVITLILGMIPVYADEAVVTEAEQVLYEEAEAVELPVEEDDAAEPENITVLTESEENIEEEAETEEILDAEEPSIEEPVPVEVEETTEAEVVNEPEEPAEEAAPVETEAPEETEEPAAPEEPAAEEPAPVPETKVPEEELIPETEVPEEEPADPVEDPAEQAESTDVAEDPAQAEDPEEDPELEEDQELLFESATSGMCGDNVTWNLDSAGTLTISGSGAMYNYTSPYDANVSLSPWYDLISSIRNIVVEEGVTSIGTSAFVNCTEVLSVTLPNSVTDLNVACFAQCRKLQGIEIPAGVTGIGAGVLANCDSLGWIIVDEANTTYDSRDNCNALIQTASNTLLKGCRNTVIPSSVTTIGNNAFAVLFFQDITVPEGVVSIDYFGFAYNNNLRSISLPVSLQEIGTWAFKNCNNLADVYYAGTIAQWNAISIAPDDNEPLLNAAIHCSDGDISGGGGEPTIIANGTCGDSLEWALDSAGTLTISGSGAMYDYELSGNTAPWYNYAFQDIKAIVFESGITGIGNYAFIYCDKVTSITVPEGVTSIGVDAFYECDMGSISLPGSLQSIGTFAFQNCRNLVGVTIPAGVTSLGDVILDNCSGLTYIVVESGNTAYDSRENCNAIIETASNTLLMGCANTVIPDSVTSIGNNAFSNCPGLGEITIPEGVTRIRAFAFAGCSNLAEVTIPLSLTTFDGGVFMDCTNLTDIYYAGSEDDRDEISISPDHNSILIDANWHYALPSVPVIARGTCGQNLTWKLTEDGLLKIKGTGAMTDYNASTAPWKDYRDSIETVEIGDGVTRIGNYAFYQCTNLTDLTLPTTVSTIGESAFRECSSLSAFPYSAKLHIGTEAFRGCSSLTRFDIPYSMTSIPEGMLEDCTNLTEVSIPNRITSIGKDAFWMCSSLAHVNIPASVTTIGEGAFYGCMSLTNVTVPARVKSIETFTFADCQNLVQISLPDGITSIGDGAFFDCYKLSDFTIPRNVTSIGEYAFESCTSLLQLVIPEGVTSIGAEAFLNCTNLMSVAIPVSMASIGAGAFKSCSALETVYYDGTEADWNAMDIGEENDPLLNAAMRQSPLASGQCGTSAIWAVSKDYQLTISGSGPVTDYGIFGVRAPWYSYRNAITQVTIEEGITRIGNYFLQNGGQLTELVIHEGVTSIGRYAFEGCSNLKEIWLPLSAVMVDQGAFSSCTGLTDVYYAGSEEDRAGININHEGNDSLLTNATWHYNELPPTIIARGTCGDQLTWVLDNKGVLAISGSGAMYNYNEDLGNPVPWSSESDRIVRAELTGEITTIGENAFDGCTALTDVYFAGTKAQWAAVSIGAGNSCLTDPSRVLIHCSDGIALPEGYCALTFDANGGTFYSLDGSGNPAKAIGSEIMRICQENDNVTLFRQNYQVFSGGRVVYYKCTMTDAMVQRDGYILTGWVVEETGAVYPAETTGSGIYGVTGSLVLAGDTTLKAVWEEAVTVTLDYNGGSYVSGDNQELTLRCAKSWQLQVGLNGIYIGEAMLPVLEKESFGLIGWKDLSTGTIYRKNEIIDTDHDMTLQAVWGQPITITLDPGDKSFVTDWRFWNNEVKDGFDADGKSRIPAYAGAAYEIDFSWYWPEDQTGSYYATAWKVAGDPVGTTYVQGDEIILPESDLTLEAVWGKKVRVDYDFDGGACNGPMPCTSGYENTVETAEYVIFRNDPMNGHAWLEEYMQKEGYTFAGWKVQGSSDGHIYHANDLYDLHEDTTFVAFWESNEVILTGWQKIDGKWYYYSNDGVVQTGWQKISKKWYYFGTDGVMRTGWQKISKKWYYFGTNGVMCTGWKEISSKQYYFNSSGVMQTGWQTISDKQYYLGTDGVMKTGWQKVDSKWYYLGTDGVMKTGWQKISGKWYYLGTDGVMQTGWQKISKKWYYLGTDGIMQTGWQKISKKWYYFGTDGIMRTGWQKISTKWYYFNSSGVMLTGTQTIDGKSYTFGSDGVWTGK